MPVTRAVSPKFSATPLSPCDIDKPANGLRCEISKPSLFRQEGQDGGLGVDGCRCIR